MSANFSFPQVTAPHGPGTGEDFFGNCASTQGGPDRVLALRVLESSSVTVEITVADFDTALTVRTDCLPSPDPPSAAVEVACDDDGGDGTLSKATWLATAGVWYYVILDTYGDSYYGSYYGSNPTIELSVTGEPYVYAPPGPEASRSFSVQCAGSDIDNNEITLLLPGEYRDGHAAYPAIRLLESYFIL